MILNETNEIMYQKVKSNSGAYDILFPSDYMIEKMIKEDMLEKLDFNNIPNYEHIGAQYKNLIYDQTMNIPYLICGNYWNNI